MTITYNEGIPKWAKSKIEESIKKGSDWISKKYPHIDFSKVKMNISMTRNRSLYYSSDGSIAIRVREKLHLYQKKNVGLTTPPQGLNVGYVIGTTTAIIHELTHYVQGIEGRLMSEVETTQNEVDYLREVDEFWYGQLVKF